MSKTFKIIIYWIAILFLGLTFFGSLSAALFGAGWGNPIPLLLMIIILLPLIIFLISRVVKLMSHK